MAGASASGLLRCACAASGTAVTATAIRSPSQRRPLTAELERLFVLLVVFMGMSFSERRVTFWLRSAFLFMDAALTRSLVLELGRQIEPDAHVEHQVLHQLRLGAIFGLRRGGDRRVGLGAVWLRLEVVRDDVVAEREVHRQPVGEEEPTADA